MTQRSPSPKPLVYDIGMNQGRNIPYYLSKGCRVVAVDAAPTLVDSVRSQFASDIAAGDVTVLNLGISNEEKSQSFFFNTVNTVLSSFVPPPSRNSDWEVVDVPTVRVSELLQKYGLPFFLKIDIEGYDRVALIDLLTSGIVPPQLSVEVHEIDVLCTLIAMGYTEFQFVNGRDIGRRISLRRICRIDGSMVNHDFPKHSAGPFGDDLDGQWLGADDALEKWLTWMRSEKHGWLDAHAQAPRPLSATTDPVPVDRAHPRADSASRHEAGRQ